MQTVLHGTHLDKIDLRLIHALQVEPRVRLTALAPIIGVDAATLSRRWSRLTEAGLAWVTGTTRRGQEAVVELECVPDKLDATARELQLDPYTRGIDICSGSRDLIVIVLLPDLAALADYAVRRLGSLKGVRNSRIHLINEIFIAGESWRLRELTPAEASRIPPPRPPRARAAKRVPDDLRAVIEREVWKDGRVSIASIADRYDYPPQRVADALSLLRQNGELLFRTDIARTASGWPIHTWYFVEAPASTIEATRASIAKVPAIRLAFTASSRYNLILVVWLRELSDVNRFEMALESALHGSRIADRAVVLRSVKVLGQKIGPAGQSMGQVDAP